MRHIVDLRNAYRLGVAIALCAASLIFGLQRGLTSPPAAPFPPPTPSPTPSGAFTLNFTVLNNIIWDYDVTRDEVRFTFVGLAFTIPSGGKNSRIQILDLVIQGARDHQSLVSVAQSCAALLRSNSNAGFVFWGPHPPDPNSRKFTVMLNPSNITKFRCAIRNIS